MIHALDDAADGYPVQNTKLPSSWSYFPKMCQSYSAASLATRYLVPRLSCLLLTIHRLMVRMEGKTRLYSRLYIVWYTKVSTNLLHVIHMA